MDTPQNCDRNILQNKLAKSRTFFESTKLKFQITIYGRTPTKYLPKKFHDKKIEYFFVTNFFFCDF